MSGPVETAQARLRIAVVPCKSGQPSYLIPSILISVPYHALPQIGRDFAKELAGKVLLESGNPYPSRDGEMAVKARARGTGISSAEFLPGVRLVRAFNTIAEDKRGLTDP